MPFYRLTDGLV